ncbi:SOS response-associated peptidase [Sulfitobacter sp. F26169L]|uniref:SOS response-associated peptidase n=1 Tax=Sulfitobacter sp. F26169L TaxID=2996015 RepID=UPI002260BCE6|nr:SOS response-associated peptidase [Sulfitobacter sp. F26169L]MCX7567052.1 SOS response-associated peptidase [Sulfitobacter sp. F26169L]
MCGRMAMTVPPEAMAQVFGAAPANSLPEGPNYNICPTNRIAVITGGENRPRQMEAMRWGLIPHWYKKPNDGPLLINARAETVLDKPAFRSAVHTRRALVVASGFYEWTKDAEGGRDPWYITRRDGAPLAFAGLWQSWTDPANEEELRTVAALTIAANTPMQAIHHRMPVIVEQPDFGLWLGEQGKGAAALMRAAGDDILQWHRVDRKVNSNRASGPELIEPWEPDNDS